jgi:hypothetical protein
MSNLIRCLFFLLLYLICITFFKRLIKQLAKPLTTRLTTEADKRPLFSSFCEKFGQMSHQLYSRVNIIASGYRVLTIKPLSPEEARSIGITTLSELVMMIAAAAIIVAEYARSEAKNAVKAAATAKKEADHNQYLKDSFESIDARLKEIDARMSKIESMLPPESSSVSLRFVFFFIYSRLMTHLR